MKRIKKIVITGGVCSGKTSCMPVIKQFFEQSEYGLIFVPESASALVETGTDLRKTGTAFDFQEAVLLTQLHSEEEAIQRAEIMPENNILIFLDRGAADAFGYLSEADAENLSVKYGLAKSDLLHRYDAVIHLVTAADGAEEYYTLANNAARTESPDEAKELDKRIQAAWAEHPRHIIIGNDGSFDDKLKAIINTINQIIRE